MLLGVLFLFLISNCFAVQNKNEVCSILSICDNIALIRSQVAAIRDEQGRQANILEGSVSASGLNDSTTKINDEVCSILSICNNLADLSAELAAVSDEQERQADLLEKSCKPETDSLPANCYEAQKSGVTEIRVPEYNQNPFKVACDQESHGGGWTVILRRTDGSEDFYREWKDYQEGFGQVDNEYFVGLERLHAMTSSVQQELLVIVEEEARAGDRYMLYDNFRIGGESNNYTLESLGGTSGTAPDGLYYHRGMQFTTKDRDNDKAEKVNCAELYIGAWWYENCHNSNLAGLYGKELSWTKQLLKTAIMMIRPRDRTQKN